MDQGEKGIESGRPEAILFDLGSTLLHDSLSGGLSLRMRANLEKRLFAPFVDGDFDLPSALADAMDEVYRGGLQEFHVKKWLESNLNHAALHESGSAEELERIIRTRVLSYSPPDGARRVLEGLMREGMPMGVVSNSIFSSDLLWDDIRRLSVPDAFGFVISSAEFGLRKPHPAIFRAGVEKLRSRPSATWYVGDLWVNDVEGSSNAGLVPVWLNAKDPAPPESIPHRRAKNWTELGAMLGI